ncbi:MAG: preprotein translocase subunit YajC [Fibrobacter sp.]|nr:preprotein translocase subunit YajC [Fibrobacter sp.]
MLESPLFPMILMFVVLYFFILRPKQKEAVKTDEMRQNLKKGDKVVTIGGIFGVVQNVKKEEKIVVLKLNNDTKVDFESAAIQRLVNPPQETK